MSSCTECHGMAGEEYDDHTTDHCPRLTAPPTNPGNQGTTPAHLRNLGNLSPTNPDTEELKLCDCDGSWHIEGQDGVTRYVDMEDECISRYIQKERQKAVEDFVAFLDEWPLAEPLLGSPRQHVYARAKDYFTHQKESLEKEK